MTEHEPSSGTVELRLLALMLKSGDFSPILSGDITESTFCTDAGKILFNFITTFRKETDGAASYPSLAIAQHRFRDSAIDLRDPDPGDSLEALAYAVKRERVRTEAAVIGHELELAAANNASDLDNVVSGAYARLKNLVDPIRGTRRASFSGDINDVLEAYDNGSLLQEGIPWAWPSLTKATRGMQRKEFYIISGRPKSRKTFVAIAAAAYAVREQNARVLFVSPEMPPRQVLLRYIATHCKLRYSEFKLSNLTPEEEEQLLGEAKRYGRLDGEDDDTFYPRLQEGLDLPDGARPCFEVIQGTGRTVEWVESQIEIYQPDIVMVDSFYRMRAAGTRSSDADWKQVTQISRALKDLAMNSDVVVIGTHQMNRAAEGKIGSTATVALSDAISQDGDIILQVITGKIGDQERSALWVIGGREVPVPGVLINNEPCHDFGEIGPIKNKKQVQELMEQEEEKETSLADREEEAAKKAQELRQRESASSLRGSFARKGARTSKTRKTKTAQKN